jgi:hypothetical protein
LLTVVLATPARSAVTLSFDVTTPTFGPYDVGNLLDDATIPGGTTPGGGTYNSQAYTDNAGPPGQTFTTLATKHLYALNALSLKGVGDSGGVIDAAVTWGVRISEVSGSNLIPLKTATGIPTLSGAVGDEWVKVTFTGADVATLSASKQYAFEVYTTGGWFGIDATQGDASYTGGTAFNSAGPARSFSNNTLGNIALRGYDRTFVAHMAAPAGGPGDVNNSGAADINDYHIIRNNLEKSVTQFANGDLNGDSFVDLNDFRLWRLSVPPAVAAQAAIPEPGAAGLLLVGFALVASRRRRRG